MRRTLPAARATLLASLPLLCAAPIVLSPAAALAIPEAQAIEKLAVIPVFVLTNDQGVPLPIPRDKTLILPMYLDRKMAETELANFNKANAQLKARVLPIPLNVANDKVQELNKQLKDGRTLIAPVVPRPVDLKEAAAILNKQGVTDKQIQEGLNTPVFFTRPFLTINTPQGQRGVFFFRYDDLQKALSAIPDANKLVPQAADLTAAVREIVKAKEDVFVFFPTPDYFALVQEQQRQQQQTPAAGSAPAPAPAPKP
ncbi:MAG: hypothetical protein FJ077_00455 [Cyanobacteria bacterium K_DeepCast_35m_m2_023]|nr:hypothetical protein [Cyanobacteria bacterium K_DeepCast_35m_m2_023]